MGPESKPRHHATWTRGGESVDREVVEASAEGGLGVVAGVNCGDVIAGKYRVEAVLGVGGMGVVVAARHVQLDDRVAIKVLRPQMAAIEEAVVRFSQEARAAAKMKSDHAARVFDVGTLENGAPYLVMELLEGRDLGAWLATDGPLPIERAVDFVLQACAAMADAHSLGIIHRDIKPSNLFCCRRRDGQSWIKVLDFGISKATDAISRYEQGVTRSNTVLGTPAHMSPEQMRGTVDVDARADVWALGVTLYELLSGTLPFSGEAFVDVANRVMTAPPPLGALRPDVPADLEAAILTCLEKDRMDRFANVADLAAALVPFGSGRAQAWADQCLAVLRTARSLSNSDPGSTREPPKPAHVGSLAPIGHTREPALADRRRLGVSAAVALAELGGVGLFRVLSGTRSTASLDTKPAVTRDLVAVPSRPSPSTGVEAVAATATVTFDSLTPPARPTKTTRTPTVSGVWLRDAGAAEAGAQVRAPLADPGSRTSCTPPYTIDSAGHRRYKPECP
jgi:serine/threonine protein kinase